VTTSVKHESVLAEVVEGTGVVHRLVVAIRLVIARVKAITGNIGY